MPGISPALRRCTAPAATTSALGAAALAAAFTGTSSTRLPTVPCVFHGLTGWSCPLCGLTRGVRLALHGDIGAAVAMNPLTPFVLVGAVACLASWFAGAATDREPASYRVVGWTLRILRHPATWTVLVAFAVLRNLPGMGALRP